MTANQYRLDNNTTIFINYFCVNFHASAPLEETAPARVAGSWSWTVSEAHN
jgi:hypothetical protein